MVKKIQEMKLTYQLEMSIFFWIHFFVLLVSRAKLFISHHSLVLTVKYLSSRMKTLRVLRWIINSRVFGPSKEITTFLPRKTHGAFQKIFNNLKWRVVNGAFQKSIVHFITISVKLWVRISPCKHSFTETMN